MSLLIFLLPRFCLLTAAMPAAKLARRDTDMSRSVTHRHTVTHRLQPPPPSLSNKQAHICKYDNIDIYI